MKISQVKKVIIEWWQQSLPPLMLWGPPGVGKSSAVSQICEQLKVPLIDLRVSLLEPIDLLGLPSIAQGKTTWNTPEFLPTEGQGILFLDEINLGTREILKSLYQLILDRRIGRYLLPPGWKIVAAGNRSCDQSGVTPLPAPLLNRFIHLEVEPDIEDWATYLLKQVSGSENVISYVFWRQEVFSPAVGKVGEANFPTPRTWEQVARVLTSRIQEEETKWSLVAGLVSLPIATELKRYIQIAVSVDPETMVDDPQGFERLERSLRFAGLFAIVSKDSISLDKKVAFLRKISPEYGVLGIKLMFQKVGTSLLKVPGIKEWAAEVKDLLL